MKQSLTILAILITIAVLSCSEKDSPVLPTGPPQSQTLEGKLSALPGVTVTEIAAPDGYARAFEIDLPQPIDHDNPSGQQFSQRIYISHLDESAPTVFVTWGYMIERNRIYYLTEYLNANQIYIDHRYFGDAAPPDPIDWSHLSVLQAAEDCHRIVELLSPIYTGPWISHGISKGGSAALYHRRYYPDDVMATVAQVTPLSVDTADARFDSFLLNEVGGADCRERILQFQRLVLSRRDSLLPLYEAYATQQELNFTFGLETVFEINILEFLFYYWQYGPHDCTAVPDSTFSTQAIFDYLQASGEIGWLQDEHMEEMAPAWYQFYTELGYYRLIDDHVADLLQSPHELSYSLFCPPGVARSFDPAAQQDLIEWLQTDGDKILYIYGQYDPNTACAVGLTGQANALKIILPGESHMAGFWGYDSYEPAVRHSLENWLGITIDGAGALAPVDQQRIARALMGLKSP